MFDVFNEDKFDFETWAQLAETDPEAFEAQRKALMDNIIQSSPEYLQQRLKGLQFQIDSQRELAKNPIDSMNRIYTMMMENVYKENGLLHAMEALTQPGVTKPLSHKTKKKKAEIIEFDAAEG